MDSNFLFYLLKASISLFLFWGVFILFLKKETYFNINRAYLLVSIALSLLIPTLKIKNEIVNETIISPIKEFTIPIHATTIFIEDKIETNFDLLSILTYIYLAGVIILAIKLLYQLYKLILFIKKGKIEIKNRHYLICTNGQYPTSSFFNYILWDNSVSLSEKEIDQIIKHEMAHIKHWHSLDNLFLEITGIILWFNPLMYFINKHLKQIHEYIADKEVVSNKDYSKEDYEILINKQVLNNIGFQLSNNFNMSNFKNRITMISKPGSGKIATLKLLLAFPVIALMTIIFSIKPVILNAQNSATLSVEEQRAKAVNNKGQGIHTTVGGWIDGKLTVQQLLDAGKLETYKDFTITSFAMAYNKAGTFKEFISESASYTLEMKNEMKNLTPGGRVFFEHVIAKKNDEDLYIKIPGCSIIIVE